MKHLGFLVFIACFSLCFAQFGGIDPNQLKQLPPDFIAKIIAQLLIDNPPLLNGLLDLGLAALPLLTGPPPLSPVIVNSLVQYGLENLPKLLKNEIVVKFVHDFKVEMNKANISGINQTDYNAIMNKVFEKADVVNTFVSTNQEFIKSFLKSRPEVLVNTVMTLFGLSDMPGSSNMTTESLKLNFLEIASHITPWLSSKIPGLLDILDKILPKVVHLLYDELNKINVKDFNKTDNDAFVGELFRNFDILRFLQRLVTLIPASGLLPLTSRASALGLTDECYYQTMGFIDNLLMGNNWAAKMLDAAGKPPTGLLTGNLHFIGNYDECLAVIGNISTANSIKNIGNLTTIASTFGGQYCRATFALPDSLVKGLIGEVDTHGIPIALTWGMCLPDSCGQNDVRGLTHIGLLDNFDLNPVSVVCSQDFNLEQDKPAITIMAVMILVICFVGLCTIIQIFLPQRVSEHFRDPAKAVYLNNAYSNDITDELPAKVTENSESPEDHERMSNGKGTQTLTLKTEMNGHLHENELTVIEYDDMPGFGRRLISAFAFHTNVSRIMSVDAPPDSIECIYGIRFVSMVMVMLGSSYIYNVLSFSDSYVTANLLDALDMLKRFSFQIVLSSSYDTDTFLMISGCLIAYRLIEKAKKIGSFRPKTWIGFYIRRYIRITPAYMIVMMAFSCFYHYIGHGPMWPETLEVGDRCKTTWWHNILYVNNFLDNDGKDAYHQCMPWSWHLAVVMQFYLITPILVICFLISKYLGSLIVILLMLAGITSAGFKEHAYGGDLMSMSTDGGAYWNNVFIKPWCRVAAYCIGVLLGFILTRRSNEDNKPNKSNKVVAVIGWILSLSVTVLFVFVTYTKNREGGVPWTSVQQAVYEAVGRPAWAACIAWVVYACYTGVGGFVNSFFSWRGFIPLSRLTFVVYLLNPIMMVLYVYSKRTLVYLGDYDMIYLLFGHIMITYLAAIPIAATFEYPFMFLERAIKRKMT